MKKAILLTFVFVTLMAMSINAQTVNVTFVINTATYLDTVTQYTNVTVTGSHTAITGWGDGIKATNIGGDYWQATAAFTAGDTVNYKFRISGGWESDIIGVGYASNGNHHLVVGTADSTLPVEFYNNSGGNKDQYWKPWGTSPAGKKTVYFRTNMRGYSGSFDPLIDTVGVRGDHNTGTSYSPDIAWGTTTYLTREGTSGMAGQIWSGAIVFNTAAFGDTLSYKFIIKDDWGRSDANNRNAKIPFGADTTLPWVWFNDAAPVVRTNTDTVDITFIANMTTAVQKQSFALGDTVQVKVGSFSTADSERVVTLVKQGGTQNYAATIHMVTLVGAQLDYQYYLQKYGQNTREYFYNFDYTGIINGEAEKRQVTVTSAGGAMTVTDDVVSETSGRRRPYFQNMGLLSQAVAVTWEVDLRPAYYAVRAGKTLKSIQPDDRALDISLVNIDSIKVWGLIMNGPATLASGDWGTWGRSLWADTLVPHHMYDDGTHGDRIADDTIYSKVINYTTSNTVGQIFKFGIGGYDDESGYGLNHMDNIDASAATYTLSEQFGSINPTFYNAWDYTNRRPATGTGVAINTNRPAKYALAQNYPNPFNPSTTIQFSLAEKSIATLKVFNLLGQEVATLYKGMLNAGQHEMSFDAKNLSSSVYFYRLTAGEFTSIKKMIMLK